MSATVTTSDGTGAMNSNANAGNANNTLPAGSFTITGDYTCPTATSEVYLVGIGGNPGLGSGTNANLALMTALGQCGSLSSSTYVVLNELTTISTIAALSNFITSYANVGSGSSDSSLLQTAFSVVNEYTDTTSGTVPGPALPEGYSASSVALQTLGDIVAACVNSAGGVAGDGSPCGQLFTLATISGSPAPTDTVGAIINILHQPTANVAQIFALLPTNSPFQPALSDAPADWELPITSNTATQLVFTVQPSGTIVGTPISPAVAVTIEDAGGNPQTSATNTVTLAIGANPNSGALGGTLSVNAVGGVATFSNLSINNVGTGYTLTASSSGLTGATSGTFNVTAAIAFVSASHTICSQTSGSSGAACTLAAPTTAGNTVIAGLTWHTTSASINTVAGSATSSYFFPYAQVCGAGSCSAILICRDCAALTSVTPNFTQSTLYNLTAEEYSGVAAIGITATATGTSAAPGVTITTGDPNDWLVAVTSSPGNSGVPSAGVGNLRNAARTGSSSSGVAGAACDNTVAAAGSLSCSVGITSGAWSAVGVELRTTYPATYIWPDCDATHPCVIHEKDTVALGTSSDVLTGPFKVTVPPTLPGNLMKLTISHPSAKTITSLTDDQSNTWTTGATTTDSENAVTTEVRYVCGAAAGTSVITVAFSEAITDGNVAQFSYDEVSGIAPSACGDGNSGSSGNQGVLNPGPITTTSSGDMVFTFGICASNSTESGNQAGVAMPDDLSAKIAENDFDQFMSMVHVQASAGPINPTIYANAQDVNNNYEMYWNTVSQAFKASSGAGTQPSGVHVVTDMHFVNWDVLGWDPLPSNGNAIVFSTSNPSSGYGMTNLADNYGATYNRTPFTDPAVDPQQYSACLGANVSARDRIFSFTPDVVQTHVEIYTISGAENATGTGCVGTTVNHAAGIQGAAANDNIVGDPVITPTINAGANSLIIATSYVGTGPPSGMCISGGVAPPACTGQSAGVVFNSIYATGMTDQSSWSTGDPFEFFYTNSTSPRSMDYLMANGTAEASYYGAAIEIMGAGP